ncbi:MAG: hypothetical protein LBH45_00660 [Campylobacteraceae bacterium]|jgi:hypothetical protein|nr:hypothetical protein [Campylobacteraceae bacterium]
MNDMFDSLKELKQKLKSEKSSKQTSKKSRKTALYLSTNDKEERLKLEFQEFMKEAGI